MGVTGNCYSEQIRLNPDPVSPMFRRKNWFWVVFHRIRNLTERKRSKVF
jgi:hypothetical protein